MPLNKEKLNQNNNLTMTGWEVLKKKKKKKKSKR